MTQQTLTPPGMVNIRDVAHANPRMHPGVLLRSDAPLRGDDEARYRVAWPPRTVVDLRDLGEGDAKHPLADHADVVRLPVLGGATRNIDELPATLGALYRSMLEAPAASRLVRAIETIAHSPAPVLVHCTAGKDRTGVIVAVALRLIGVPREAVVADYMLTASAMPGILARIPRTVAPETRARIMPRATHAEQLLGVPAAAMQEFLAALEGHEEATRGWFTAYGGQPSTVETLRTRLLVGADAPNALHQSRPDHLASR